MFTHYVFFKPDKTNQLYYFIENVIITPTLNPWL